MNNSERLEYVIAKSQFSQHFVKTGKFETRFGRLLNTLYDWRQRGDYENLFMYNKESVEPMLESCLDMIQQIEAEIKRNV